MLDWSGRWLIALVKHRAILRIDRGMQAGSSLFLPHVSVICWTTCLTGVVLFIMPNIRGGSRRSRLVYWICHLGHSWLRRYFGSRSLLCKSLRRSSIWTLVLVWWQNRRVVLVIFDVLALGTAIIHQCSRVAHEMLLQIAFISVLESKPLPVGSFVI